MNIKSLLLGSAAAMSAISGARAADVIVAEPEPVEYVRVCDAYGAGYFYIPGTQTCMRISGYVRADFGGGDNVGARSYNNIKRDTYDWRTRATLFFHTASETDLGTLRTLIELRSDWNNGSDNATGQLRKGFIELGGLRAGVDDTIFEHWTGYYGNVIHDDILNPTDKRTNVISYTYNAGNGFSAVIGIEQGNISSDWAGVGIDNDGNLIFNGTETTLNGIRANDYTPNFVGGLKFVQGWGGISAVAGYDSLIEEWAGKVRVDININDRFSLWAMGGYKSGHDAVIEDGRTWQVTGVNARTIQGWYRVPVTQYGDWGGEWAAWIGGTYKFTPKTSFNFQTAYDDSDTFIASVNLAHELVPGLTITPELTYASWEDDAKRRNAAGLVTDKSSMKGQDAFQGMVRLQRSF
ncbi:MAG: Porin [Candidatus Tokpelaia hoelldobleri]|uniref:Porin n=1 Tax=Candidatus Tokpelaia hoelldobleri TaxID=1902579 RepID=A0A1U9JVS5_9HYPH|nr:MAG: Porin [Candidatus Tokpelaia hoelldoblerii]